MQEGQLVGNSYRIERKIGEGGFGAIFLARHLQLDREVAIKALRSQESPFLPDLVQRFEREVSLARKLEHPNIVRLYDHGRFDDGTLYMVMEYIRGVEVEEVLRNETRVAVDRATHIVVQILDALAEAHGLGIVHRDLKPSNVMLTRSGLRNDVVKLLDFGIAKAFDGTYADLTAQNLSQGVGFGTPQYMAPEQIMGRDIGPHTDLYAVGLIYLELMTGFPPMLGAHPADTIRRQLEDEVPISHFLRLLPVGPVLERALIKDWRKRYQSAAEMFADIEQLVTPELGTSLVNFMLPDEAMELPEHLGGPAALPPPKPPTAMEAPLRESPRPPDEDSGPTVLLNDPELSNKALEYAQQEGWVASPGVDNSPTGPQSPEISGPLGIARNRPDQPTVPVAGPPPMMMASSMPLPVAMAPARPQPIPIVVFLLAGIVFLLLLIFVLLLAVL